VNCPQRCAAGLLGLLLLQVYDAAAAAEPPLRPSYGRQEHVRVVGPTPVEVIAALEPGAEYSILNAVGIKYYQHESATWVRFTVDNGSVLPGNRAVLERPVLKDYKVHQRDGGYEHQPEVSIELCLGVQNFTTAVRLVERQGYTAPLLLAQPDLAHLGSVDKQRQFTQEPRCIPPQPQNQQLPPNPLAAPKRSASITAPATTARSQPPAASAIVATSNFQCDGRTRCSEMSSCAEAEYFLSHCPAVKMDGDGDGIPCEEQWCGALSAQSR